MQAAQAHAHAEAWQHVYVVKVRALPDPALLFPSERRYSALTVAGLAAGHALLGGVALLLGVLALSWDPPAPAPEGSWFGHLGAGLWLGAAALQASVCGVLAWRRWYEDRYIAWFFRASLLAAVVAGAGLVLTSAALVHLHENVLHGAPAAHEEYQQHGYHQHGAPAPVVADEGSGGGPGGPGSSWLDLAGLPDSNSSTISSGGVFSDLVRDQDDQDHDLVAADSTRHEDSLLGQDHAEDVHAGEPEWSVLRWVPVPLSPRASAQIRSLVAVNVMVACFLELLWSLLGARLAWRGMQVPDEEQAPGHGTPGVPSTRPAAAATPAAPTAPLATLVERGAADGKVDVDTDNSVNLSDGELGKSKELGMKAQKKKKLQQQAKGADSADSLQRRRRAPELPVLPLSLEQQTMNLEERVARLLGAGAEHAGQKQDDERA